MGKGSNLKVEGDGQIFTVVGEDPGATQDVKRMELSNRKTKRSDHRKYHGFVGPVAGDDEPAV